MKGPFLEDRPIYFPLLKYEVRSWKYEVRT
jgi:hypothetical protein